MKDIQKTNEEQRQEWRNERLKELNNLPIEEDFEIPKGLFIPFGRDVLIKEIKQGEIKRNGIIVGIPTSKTVGASIGVIYAKGEDCFKPLYEGMRVYYEPQSMLRVYCNNDEYIQLPEDFVFGAAPPETYLQPYVADTVAKRRESRIAGEKKVRDRDSKQFEEKVGKREEVLKKQDKIRP